jgi:hypothetical protein
LHYLDHDVGTFLNRHVGLFVGCWWWGKKRWDGVHVFQLYVHNFASILSLCKEGRHKPNHPKYSEYDPELTLRLAHLKNTMALGYSLAGWIKSSRSVSKYVKPVANWYANLAGYRQMGLKYDDLRACHGWAVGSDNGLMDCNSN